MIGRKMTGDEILQMIEATRKQIDPSALQKDIQVRIAADHMVDRLLSMMNGANELHACLRHNAPTPIMRASVRFDPNKGDRSFYYFFKELESGMPWELPVSQFVAPVAVAFRLFDALDERFPSPAAFSFGAHCISLRCPPDFPAVPTARSAAAHCDIKRQGRHLRNGPDRRSTACNARHTVYERRGHFLRWEHASPLV